MLYDSKERQKEKKRRQGAGMQRRKKVHRKGLSMSACRKTQLRGYLIVIYLLFIGVASKHYVYRLGADIKDDQQLASHVLSSSDAIFHPSLFVSFHMATCPSVYDTNKKVPTSDHDNRVTAPWEDED